MKVNRELDKHQKAVLYDRLKEAVKDIVNFEGDIMYWSDYQRLIETLERDEIE